MPTRTVLFTAMILVFSMLGSCSNKGTEPAVEDELKIPETTKFVPDSAIVSVEPGKCVYIEAATDKDVHVGDIIVSDHELGLISRVVSVTATAGIVTAITEQASINEAIERCSISYTKNLTEDDLGMAAPLIPSSRLQFSILSDGFYISLDDVVLYDEDEDPETDNDQVTAEGSISINPGFELQMKINDFTLEQLKMAASIEQELTIEISACYEFLSVEKKYELYRFQFNPIVIWAGWVPVVITPILTINVGLDGEAYAGVKLGVTEEASFTAGLEYLGGSWSPIASLDISCTQIGPQLTAGCSVKGYAGPQLNFLFYGVVGPYAEMKGYVELEADIFETPWWELYGGLEVDVGVRLEMFSKDIADYECPGVIGYRRTLAQADGVPSGTITGIVRNAVTLAAIEGAAIEAFFENELEAGGTTLADGTFALNVPFGEDYEIRISKEGYLPEVYMGITVSTNNITYLETVLQIDEAYAGTGSISGKIVSALSGYGVDNVRIDIRRGINVLAGDISATAYTSYTGNYSIAGIEAGNYTAALSCQGYNTSHFTITCIGGQDNPGQDATITPILSDDEIRIILTWGPTPYDLDSHLTGPLEDGSRFHMYFPFSGEYSPWPDVVTLDLDDVTSYGPETVTLYYQINGIYRYSVHDYSNRYSSTSTSLSNSGAVVRVYSGSALIAAFPVPTNQGGTLWTVFELNGPQILPVNEFSYETTPYEVQLTNGLQLSEEQRAVSKKN